MVSLSLVCTSATKPLSVLALSSRFDGRNVLFVDYRNSLAFQYSLCRVVLMVFCPHRARCSAKWLSVLALSSRFDGLDVDYEYYSDIDLSVLALSSRFDGLK